MKTFEKIKFLVNIKDEIGPYGLKPFCAIRYHLFLTKEFSLKKEDIVEKSKKYSNLYKNNYSEPKIYCDELIAGSLITYDAIYNEEV